MSWGKKQWFRKNRVTHHQAATGHIGALGPSALNSGRRKVRVDVGSQKNIPRSSEAIVPLSPPAGGKKMV